jgi:L-rhamnose-H+ transport protein
MNTIVLGVVITLVAGVLNGSFAAPTKYVTKWKWENIWAVWAVFALFITIWPTAFLTVPDLFSLYGLAGTGPLLLVIAFGLGNGVAQIFFGLGVAAIGLSLGFAIAIGISTALGSLGPLVLQHPELLSTPKGLTILAGVAVIIAGIAVCAVAGKAKEKAMSAGAPAGDAAAKPILKGLMLSVIAGVLSPTTNFAVAFGGPLLKQAADHGASAAFQANVLWPPFLTATLIPYMTYCVLLWKKNNSFRFFSLEGTGHYYGLGAVMGLLWTSSLVMFGAVTTYMGTLGPVLGWPLFMSVIIITSNVWGFATGEWKQAGGKPVKIMLSGIGFLILGFCTLAYASSLS